MFHQERINWVNAETDWKKKKPPRLAIPSLFCLFVFQHSAIRNSDKYSQRETKNKKLSKKLVIGKIECVLTENCLSHPWRNSVLTAYVVLAQNRSFKFSSNVLRSEASFLAKFAGDVGPQGSPELTESKLTFEEENS